MRFEAALRLLAAMVEVNLSQGELIGVAELKTIAESAVDGADVLLKALDKEKP